MEVSSTFPLVLLVAVVFLTAIIMVVAQRRRTEVQRTRARTGSTTQTAPIASPRTAPATNRHVALAVVVALLVMLGAGLFYMLSYEEAVKERDEAYATAVSEKSGAALLQTTLYGQPVRRAPIDQVGPLYQTMSDSVRKCDSLLTIDPDNVAFHLAKARAYRRMEMPEEAAGEYESAFRLANDDIAVRYEYATSLVDIEQRDAADSLILAAPDIDDNDADAIAAYGHLLVYTFRTVEAEQQYKRAVLADPNCTNAFIGLGVLSLVHRTDHDVAISHFGTALDLDSTDADAWNNLGLAHIQRGSYHGGLEAEYSEAQRCFEQAVSLDPTNPVYRHNLSYTERERASDASG
jgi:tetratricopeptide (TPR) repeat protein